MIGQYGYLEDFINELRSDGRHAFSLPEVRNKFEQSDEAIKKALQRLKKRFSQPKCKQRRLDLRNYYAK